MKSCTRCGAAFEADGEICPHCRRETNEAARYASPLSSEDLPPEAVTRAIAPEPPGPGIPAGHEVLSSGAGDDGDDGDDSEGDPEGETRRRFLTNTALTVGGVVGVGYLGLAVRYLFPNVTASAAGLQDVGPVSSFPSLSPTLTTIVQDGVNDGVYVVNLAKNGTPTQNQLLALDFHCTHLNCPITWYPGVNGIGRYICPCHGSQFTITGQHVAGPAPRPLFRHQLVLKNGRVLIGGIIS